MKFACFAFLVVLNCYLLIGKTAESTFILTRIIKCLSSHTKLELKRKFIRIKHKSHRYKKELNSKNFRRKESKIISRTVYLFTRDSRSGAALYNNVAVINVHTLV